jgi:hypothetical protein
MYVCIREKRPEAIYGMATWHRVGVLGRVTMACFSKEDLILG